MKGARRREQWLAAFALASSVIGVGLSSWALGSVRVCVYVVGLVLQLGGVLVTLLGLRQVADELFPGTTFPHERAWSWMKRRLGIKPPPQRVVLGQAIDTSAVVGQARALVTKGQPRTAAPLSDWNAYWESHLDALRARIDWASEDLKQARADMRQLISDEAAARATADSQLQERLRVVVGGESGEGLTQTWWGLVAAVVGTVLTGLAGMPV